MTDVSKYGGSPKILDSSMSGCRHPIRVIKYVNGQPVSDEWQAIGEPPVTSWGRKKPLQTKVCPSCKMSYETANAGKKLCYDCQEKKTKRRRWERCAREREARKLNPSPRVRQKSKYS